VMNGYLIAFAGLLLLAGRLGDLLGARSVFIAGLGLFTVASLACGLARTGGLLVAFRFVQGAGGALASAVALGLIVTIFPDGRERARALACYAFVAAAGSSIGLILGGVLTRSLSWPWVFYVNVPLGAAAMVLALRVLPPIAGLGLREGADALGAGLVTAGLMLGVYAIVRGGAEGWGAGGTLWPLAASLLLLTAFVGRQATAARPLLPLRVLRSRTVGGANVILLLMVAGLFGYQLCSALYLQDVFGYDALRTGLAFLPAPLTIAVVSLGVAARLSGRFGARPVIVAGLALVAVALLLLARVPADGSYARDVAPAFVLMGLGFGAVMPALIGQAMAVADPAEAGIASGTANTTQQIGAALGAAILTTLAAARTESLLGHGRSATAALTGGFHLAYAVSAALVAAALVVALLVLRPPGGEGRSPRQPGTSPANP
ncbi:MFS transporter, partial [Frankia sp. EI5c]|uniref:MFS transporter n=1 Tax=Frankia sp. EI5c TaxID=683316 RepID=UPI001F5B1431